MSGSPTVYWFRRDLRLRDNQGLTAAAARGAVLPVFIWSPSEEEPHSLGSASRWWLHRSLTSLSAELDGLGSRLVLRVGTSAAELLAIVKATDARAVYCERTFDPQLVARDADVRARLGRYGIAFTTFEGALLTSPERVRSRQGKAFRVFTPFWREARALVPDASPLAAPVALESPPTWPAGEKLSALSLLPSVDWTAGLHAAWCPGEVGATNELECFLLRVDRYGAQRDYPSEAGTSRLSPYLHFGELSVRTLWDAVRFGGHMRDVQSPNESEPYLRQLGWREFAHHALYNYPHTTTEPLDASMRLFPWACDENLVQRWRRGTTGYPIVDAGMRELWQTGWMHNRARMVTASFLVKDLLCDWRRGAAWFWDTLVDADLANNTLGWQWAAGCGADAAPYFRIFNPVLQGQKFDQRGAYVRRWIPELAGLSDEWVHTPWKAPARALQDAGIVLDKDYPAPIVDHADARTRALAALAAVRSQASRASARGVRK